MRLRHLQRQFFGADLGEFRIATRWLALPLLGEVWHAGTYLSPWAVAWIAS